MYESNSRYSVYAPVTVDARIYGAEAELFFLLFLMGNVCNSRDIVHYKKYIIRTF